MDPKAQWFKSGAKVRVAVQSTNPFEGVVTDITDRGFYITSSRELHIEGMVDVQPPHDRFVGWNLFQFADLIERAP